MIDLALHCSGFSLETDPFVAKLVSAAANEDDDDHAYLVGSEETTQFFSYRGQSFCIETRVRVDLLGDVVFIDPKRQTLQRWIRATSSHNTLLVTERCDQLCVMCSQPPKKTHTDLFSHFHKACLLAPVNATIGLSGGEPTLFKDQLFELLESMAMKRPDLHFHVLTNGQHFERIDQPTLGKLRNTTWGIPLYSADAPTHDEIVAKSGAQERLLESFAVLGEAGAQIELRTVLLASNAYALPQLAHFIRTRLSFISTWAIMQLEHIGFAKNRWQALFFDHSNNFDPLREAMTIACLYGVDVNLFNFPRCTLGPEWRDFAVPSISDWKRNFPDTCFTCSEKELCGGFFEWHPQDMSYAGVHSL